MKITFKHQILFLLLISISACKKTATVTVSVNMQSVGQPVVIGANVGVLLQRVPDSSNFQIKGTSSQGVASFEKVADGTYKVSAQYWDGSKGLVDSKLVQVENGHDAATTLLLQ